MKSKKLLGTLSELDFLISHNKKVILTTGVYDVPHIGHRRYLKKAKELGDILIVILHSDALVKIRKGESRPINCEKKRIRRLRNYKYVDFIFVAVSQDDVYGAINFAIPDMLVVSETTEDLPNCPKTMLEKFAAKMHVVILPAQAEIHSTDLIEKKANMT